MKIINIVVSILVIFVSAAVAGILIYLRPEMTIPIIIIYLSALLMLTISNCLIGIFNARKKSAIEADDFVKVMEDLNTEFILWTDDLSFIRMNKRIRDLMDIGDDDGFDHKEALKKAFGLNDLDNKSFKLIAAGGSHEATFKNSSDKVISIAWSTTLVKKVKKRSLYISTGFNFTEIKKMRVNLASANDFFNSSMELAEIGVIMSTDKKKICCVFRNCQNVRTENQ